MLLNALCALSHRRNIILPLWRADLAGPHGFWQYIHAALVFGSSLVDLESKSTTTLCSRTFSVVFVLSLVAGTSFLRYGGKIWLTLVVFDTISTPLSSSDLHLLISREDQPSCWSAMTLLPWPWVDALAVVSIYCLCSSDWPALLLYYSGLMSRSLLGSFHWLWFVRDRHG